MSTTYIMIDDNALPTDTDAEIQAAREALRDAGIDEAKVYVTSADDLSDSEGESYPNGQILFAAEEGIEYTYLDERRAECTAVYSGDCDEAIAAAVDKLDAEVDEAAGTATYHADEADEDFTVTLDQMAQLGAALIEQPHGDVYSLWCARVL